MRSVLRPPAPNLRSVFWVRVQMATPSRLSLQCPPPRSASVHRAVTSRRSFRRSSQEGDISQTCLRRSVRAPDLDSGRNSCRNPFPTSICSAISFLFFRQPPLPNRIGGLPGFWQTPRVSGCLATNWPTLAEPEPSRYDYIQRSLGGGNNTHKICISFKQSTFGTLHPG